MNRGREEGRTVVKGRSRRVRRMWGIAKWAMRKMQLKREARGGAGSGGGRDKGQGGRRVREAGRWRKEKCSYQETERKASSNDGELSKRGGTHDS